MLFSEGFANAKTLSRKMVKLYKLSSEQLSQQDHYVSTRACARISSSSSSCVESFRTLGVEKPSFLERRRGRSACNDTKSRQQKRKLQHNARANICAMRLKPRGKLRTLPRHSSSALWRRMANIVLYGRLHRIFSLRTFAYHSSPIRAAAEFLASLFFKRPSVHKSSLPHPRSCPLFPSIGMCAVKSVLVMVCSLTSANPTA
jgi:hypothetical protein